MTMTLETPGTYHQSFRSKSLQRSMAERPTIPLRVPTSSERVEFDVARGLPSVPPSGRHVLVVEDDVDQSTLLTRWLGSAGYRVTVAASFAKGMEEVSKPTYDVILCDLDLPDGSGLDIAKESKRRSPKRPCAIATAKGDMGTAVEALRHRVDEFLVKPLTKRRLLESVEDLVRKPESATSVLAIGAHPDDVEIGIGGILERHRRGGDRITILTCTGGASGGVEGARTREAQAAARRLRAKLCMGSLPDTAVSDGQATIALIEEAIAASGATTIYTHSLHDMHQDHRAVHRATLVAARAVPNLFCYQSPSTTTAFQPSHFVDVGDAIEAKLQLIACHESQRSRAYLQPELVTSTARYWGRFAGYGEAEPLEVVRSQG